MTEPVEREEPTTPDQLTKRGLSQRIDKLETHVTDLRARLDALTTAPAPGPHPPPDEPPAPAQHGKRKSRHPKANDE